ncbi:MAG TPA: endolytic transglycosylase MltG [Nitrospira sp.]|nr:endolytic transglycosylase MltG [Nitrospira sp.]
MTFRTMLALLLITAAAVGIAAYRVITWAEGPAASPQDHPPSKVVVIPDGSNFHQVATLLERERLIRSRFAFIVLGRFQSVDRKIHAGEYELSAAMLPSEILSRLLNGQVVLHPVTIPEGLTMGHIADLLHQHGVVDRTEFLRLGHDRSFIASLGLNTDSLEGYLYPDTYNFPRPIKAKDVATAMVDRFKQMFGPDLRARALELNMSEHDVVTLASIIEKETGATDERPEISAVFHNRLKKHIPLQSDPTVIYGLTSFDGNIRKKDLSSPSPYNTYKVTGLPPGPISNPGLQAIRATLFPSASRALYFVSRNDGTHQFSATLAEHNQAVEKYQKRPFRRGQSRNAAGAELRLPAVKRRSTG